MSRPILLVEDNDQDEKLIVRALRKVNLHNQLEIARDGQQALDILFGPGEPGVVRNWPAVILLDISLPRVSGLEVLRRLRAYEPTRLLPVVMLTSSDDDHDRLKSYLDGANSFVRKPLEFKEFAETVANLGVYWMAVNVAPQ